MLLLCLFAVAPTAPVVVGPQDPIGSALSPVPALDDSALTAGVLRPLALQDALGLALSNNLGLERANIEAEAARFDALGSWGAFDWVFDASGSFSDSKREGSGFLDGGDEVNTENSRIDLDLTRPLSTGGTFVAHFDTQLNSTDNPFADAPDQYQQGLRLSYVQPLSRGAWSEYTTATQRTAEITERTRLEERRQARQQLVHDVQVAYWELVAATQQLEVARSALQLGAEQVTREEARIQAGDGTEVDVLQAETQVATRTETLLQAENDVAQRSDDLKRLMYRDRSPEVWERPLLPTTPLPEATSQDANKTPGWQDAFEVALNFRSDLRRARNDLDTQRLNLTRAQSERLHGLDLELAASSGAVDPNYSQSFRDASEFDFPTFSLTLRYNMPLQNRAASNAERAARERVRGSQVALEEAEVTALSEVRQAIRDVHFRAQAVTAAEQSATLARRQLEAEQKRFEADLSTTFEVLQFQQTLIESLSSRSRAAAEYAKSLVALERAQGVVGERPSPYAPSDRAR